MLLGFTSLTSRLEDCIWPASIERCTFSGTIRNPHLYHIPEILWRLTATETKSSYQSPQRTLLFPAIDTIFQWLYQHFQMKSPAWEIWKYFVNKTWAHVNLLLKFPIFVILYFLIFPKFYSKNWWVYLYLFAFYEVN